VSTLIESTTEPQVVATEDGPVTQVSINGLEELAAQRQQRAKAIATSITQLQDEVSSLQIQAGTILTAQTNRSVADDVRARVEAAHGLEHLITNLEQSISQVQSQPHHGLGGVVQGFKDRRRLQALGSQLESAKAELKNRYRAVVEHLTPPTGVPDADPVLEQIGAKVRGLDELIAQGKALATKVTETSAEIKRRKDALATLGFDAPAVEADLQVNGLRPVETSLVLKRGEIAAAVVSASLCRYRTRTQYVGGSQGLSIPLGHGFRYRVSSYRGQPIQSESLAKVDEGTLVVTNQRLVFLGSKRDISMPIVKLLQVQAFSDAVGIAREGKESRDIFLVAQPAYVVLFIQWVVSHQS